MKTSHKPLTSMIWKRIFAICDIFISLKHAHLKGLLSSTENVSHFHHKSFFITLVTVHKVWVGLALWHTQYGSAHFCSAVVLTQQPKCFLQPPLEGGWVQKCQPMTAELHFTSCSSTAGVCMQTERNLLSGMKLQCIKKLWAPLGTTVDNWKEKKSLHLPDKQS